MQSYTDALALYTERKNRGILKRGIKLGNNTYLEAVELLGNVVAFGVKLHATVIVTFHRDGRIVLNDGGWKTATTKARFNEYLPSEFRVYSDGGVWYLSHHVDTADKYIHRHYPYADGITLHPACVAFRGSPTRVTGIGPDPKLQQKLRKRIRAYAKAYIAAFYAGDVPAPGVGDCFGCSMLDSEGNAPMGGADHMLSHLDESYFVPSILHRAAKRFGVSRAAQHTLAVAWNSTDTARDMRVGMLGGIVAEQLEKAVRRHCYAEVGLGV